MNACVLLLFVFMKLTEFLDLPFIRSGIDLIDYFLSFKMIPNLMYFLVDKGENKPIFQAQSMNQQGCKMAVLLVEQGTRFLLS